MWSAKWRQVCLGLNVLNAPHGVHRTVLRFAIIDMDVDILFHKNSSL